MNELKMEIVALEEKIEEMEYQLDEASTPEQAEDLASELRLLQEDLEELQEELKEQEGYEGMTDLEYCGMSQSDFI